MTTKSANSAIITAIVAGAVGTAMAAAWAVRAGPMPGWNGTAAYRGESSAVVFAGRPYPVRLEIPRPAPLAVPQKDDRPVTAAQTAGTEAQPPVVAATPEFAPTSATAEGTPKIEGPVRPLGFDVRDFGRTGAVEGERHLKTTKPVILGGTRLGAIELAIGRGASVSVDRRALSALLDDRSPALSAALEREVSDQVTLDALRTRDVAIRYDPLADAVVIETPS